MNFVREMVVEHVGNDESGKYFYFPKILDDKTPTGSSSRATWTSCMVLARRGAIGLIAALALIAALSPGQHAEGYAYRNCADQRLQLPLIECAELAFNGGLSTVEIRDTGEAGLAVGDSGGQFRVVNSSRVPLAVPLADYAAIDRWEYRSNLYIKVARGKEGQFAWQRRPADTIAVVPDSVGLEIDLSVRSQVARNATLVFWFSEYEGITAIALPAFGHQSGEVFYCVEQPCLFAQEE